MNLPPGPLYLVKSLPGILGPSLATWMLHSLLQQSTGIHIPPSLLAALCIISFPLVLTAKVQYKLHADRRAAAACDAVLPPTVPTSFAGIDLAMSTMKDIAEKFPGEPLALYAKQHGNTMRLRILFEDRFITCEPEYLKIILATQFDRFEKGKDTQEIFGPVLGMGVFATDGELWKFHRAMTRPFFKRDRISDFELFDRHALAAIGQLKKRLAEGHPVDFQDLVSRFTMDSFAEFLFGHNAHTLGAGLPYPAYSSFSSSPTPSRHITSPSTQFASAVSSAQQVVFSRGTVGSVWPLLNGDFWIDRVRQPMHVIREFLDPILRGAVQARDEKGEGKEKMNANANRPGAPIDREVHEGETLVEHLLNYTDDQTILRDEILNISVAGRDTTSSLLTFTLYMLTQHPRAMERLRAEIRDVVGTMAAPTPEHFREMKYLRAVLNETLRLYPPVPFNIRSTITPVTLPPTTPGAKPFYIPARSMLMWSVLVMQRRTDLWGPDAAQWDPDRFIDERLHKYLTPNPFIFLPFNAGPRICLGQQFAYHEASLFLVRLLQALDANSTFSLAEEALTPPPSARTGKDELGWNLKREKVVVRNHITLYVEGGLWIRMKEGLRKDAGKGARDGLKEGQAG